MLSMVIQDIIHLYDLNVIIFLNIQQILVMVIKLILIVDNLFLNFFHFLFLKILQNRQLFLYFFLIILNKIFQFCKMFFNQILNILFILHHNGLNLNLRLFKLIFPVRNENLSGLDFMFDINHNLRNNLNLIS